MNSKGGWNVFEAVSVLAGIGNFTWLIIIGLSSEGMKSTKKIRQLTVCIYSLPDKRPTLLDQMKHCGAVNATTEIKLKEL